jgi:hypothetical protein
MIWGCHSGGYQEFYFLWYNAVYYLEIQPVFNDKDDRQDFSYLDSP